MKIPKTIKIGGMNYAVNITNHLNNGKYHADGECDFQELEIRLLDGNAPQKTERVFLHEVVHALYDNLGFKQHDEEKVDMLAGALYALVVDNPEMFRN